MYDVTFFTPERYSELWAMLEGLLKLASPSVLIVVAIFMVGMVLLWIIRIFKTGSDKEDSDDDFDIHYYD